ncbi:MAG: hypothetical protein JRE18_02535, partial [Deltaproteobacteria bacterium]|nr:hypothetical protein [Deltaproteobacteria bacterium]
MDPAAIADFVRTAGTRMGHPALSEAKMLVLTEPDRVVVIAEDDRIMAVGVVADHRQADGIVHQAVETVVDTGMQFPEFERACLSATSGNRMQDNPDHICRIAHDGGVVSLVQLTDTHLCRE